jgi:hypothetical protein
VDSDSARMSFGIHGRGYQKSTLRVNYFIGTVRMNCGKIDGIPTLCFAKHGPPKDFLGALNPSHPPVFPVLGVYSDPVGVANGRTKSRSLSPFVMTAAEGARGATRPDRTRDSPAVAGITHILRGNAVDPAGFSSYHDGCARLRAAARAARSGANAN